MIYYLCFAVESVSELYYFVAPSKVDSLSSEHVDLLWSSSLGKRRDTIVQAIYDILISLSSSLRFDLQ